MLRPFPIVILVLSVMALAHEDPLQRVHETVSQERDHSIEIRQKYQTDIKPIFQKKCFDCHSDRTRFPWYYKMLGAKQFIDRDIMEAKKHIDMTPDFPFKGHADSVQDLKAIREEVESGDMPPVMYRMMHPGAALTDDEKQKVLDWVDEGIKAIRSR